MCHGCDITGRWSQRIGFSAPYLWAMYGMFHSLICCSYIQETCIYHLVKVVVFYHLLKFVGTPSRRESVSLLYTRSQPLGTCVDIMEASNCWKKNSLLVNWPIGLCLFTLRRRESRFRRPARIINSILLYDHHLFGMYYVFLYHHFKMGVVGR